MAVRRALFACLIGMLIVFPVTALSQAVIPLDNTDEKGNAIVVPRGSPLHVAGIRREDDMFAFDGRFTISGTYYYGWVDPEEPNGATLTVTIAPDKTSLAKLPYWAGRSRPTSIEIRNIPAFVSAVVSPDTVKKIADHKSTSVKGHIVIVADKYEASIVCDGTYYTAEFVSVARQNAVIANRSYLDSGC
jgi:hypothetical protein